LPQSNRGPGGTQRLLGERLQDRGLLTGSQVDLALREQKRTGALLGEILLQLGYLTPRALAETLAEQGGVPFLEVGDMAIAPEVLALVPEGMARRLKVLPLARNGRELRLACANIFDLDAVAEVEAHTLLRAAVVGAAEEELVARVAQAYGDGRSMEEVIEAAIRLAEGDREAREAELPITRLVDQLLLKALRDRATDLHLQPEERTVLVRFRVDGALVQGPSLPKALQAAVVARLKVLAEVDLAETRKPQDGKFRLPQGRRVFDIRASFLPARHGEKVVLRILDKANLIQGLDQLGMPEGMLARFTALLDRPHGILLVTGPTGCGKTTTLYAALHRLNASDRCLVTLEDPVEYELPLLAQVSLNPKAGLTFATGLRTILRQDPDIILVGEIRDAETAALAFRAAMTGHLVLSTLHTNDPVGSIARLRDLGVSGQDVAATVLGIHAQRLVRLNCTACAVPCDPAPLLMDAGPGRWLRGAGCPACGFTGVRGRRAIHDLLVLTAPIRDLVAGGAPAAEVEAAARREGKGSLAGHALALAREGLVAPGEAVRVTAGEA